MGGDHKCPVCEATFTRPQHVARHMRSHTGDRPYKCQFCGDQFARSDLLSRHVNKCHANEKPLPSTSVRKKGSVSASRATTSKQVCDQCVQANSSCDGCNPCAKCVHRRYRCTFVKFHRQTAPLGPGHTTRTTVGAESSLSNPPSPSSSPSKVSSRDPVFHHPPHQQQSEDEFILVQPPTVVPTMADALYGATPYAFPPLYPTNEISGDNADYVGKYRAHAELFGTTRSAIPPSSSSMVSPNLYDPRPPPSSWLGWGQQDPTDAYQQQQQQRHADLIDSANPSPSLSTMNDKDTQVDLARRHHNQQYQQQRSNTNPNQYMNVPLSVLQSSTSNYHLVSDPNIGTESNDIYGSDSASSSAASSFVHLPLAGVDNISARNVLVRGGYDNNLIPDRRATSSSSSSSSSHHHHPAFQSKPVAFPTTHDENAFSSNQHHHHLSQQQQQQVISDLGRPEFSSAFGSLSLDDPNVMAGISADGTPFFDDPNQAHNQARSTSSGSTTTTTSDVVVQLGGVADVDTPMPMKRGSRQLQLLPLDSKFPTSSTAAVEMTPSREKDSKELKEFWKQYMRIPLSGSEMMSSMPGSEGVTPSANGTTTKATNTGSGYRRPRVASLPAVKTPIVERTRDDVYLDNTAHPSASTLNAGDPTAAFHRSKAPSREMPAGMEMEMDMDTSMDNSEDLRSYEAAVMARKGPTMLNLKVKRPMKPRGRAGGTSSTTTSGKLRDEGSASASASSGNNSPRASMGSGGGGDTTDCSSSSSLANAFGTGRLARDQMFAAAATHPFAAGGSSGRVKKEESSSPSLPSPASSSAEGDESDMGVSPLINSNNSRNMMGRPSFKRLPSQTLGPDNSKRPFYGFGDEVEDRVVSGWGSAIAGGGDNDDDRKDGAEKRMRKRRMSEPSTAGGGASGFDREDKKTSRVDVSAVQNVDELWFY